MKCKILLALIVLSLTGCHYNERVYPDAVETAVKNCYAHNGMRYFTVSDQSDGNRPNFLYTVYATCNDGVEITQKTQVKYK